MSTIAQQLNKGRQELLDLSTRNRLLNIPTASRTARVITIHDELAAEVYRQLVEEGKAFTLAPGVKNDSANVDGKPGDPDSEEAALPQPEHDDSTGGTARRHLDTRLQTKLKSEVLQRRLLDMYYDARTFIEEQGVNILYLAIGHLKWFDVNTPEVERFAPLLLVPVQLNRKGAGEKFNITWNQEDPAHNLSLAAKLKTDFELGLPEFKGTDEFSIAEYFSAVSKAIERRPNWEVLPNAMTLGFFSFAKFLMYRDLDSTNWPEQIAIDRNPMISQLLGDGFRQEPDNVPEDARIDDLIKVHELSHVVDADSSQTLAIHSARQGRSLVIQGPPGTGKSQTIANVIAAAVADGKRVLFVAEKMAALEVVYRRLDNAGLGAMCLELHSNKANKRQVLEELKRTKDLGRPTIKERDEVLVTLDRLRQLLNQHAAGLHQRLKPSGVSPYETIGNLVRLSDTRIDNHTAYVSGARAWARSDRQERRSAIKDIAERLSVIGIVGNFPWRGVHLKAVLRTDLDRLVERLGALSKKWGQLLPLNAELSGILRLHTADTVATLEKYLIVADEIAKAPELDKQAIRHSVWNAGVQKLKDIIEMGRTFSKCRTELADHISDAGWSTPVEEARRDLAMHGGSFFAFLSKRYRTAIATLRSIHKTVPPKELAARIGLLDTLIRGQQALASIGEADAIGHEAFGAVWRKDRSDWSHLEAIVSWIDGHKKLGLPETFREIFASISQPTRSTELTASIRSLVATTLPELEELFKQLQLNLGDAFGATDSRTIPIQDITDRIHAWLDNHNALPIWVAYSLRATRARELGLAGILSRLENGSCPLDGAEDYLERAIYEALLDQAVEENEKLAQFDGAHHTRLVEDFRALDKARMDLAKMDTAKVHFDGMPKGGTGIGAMGVLNAEMVKRKGHMPLRKLLRTAGSAVQAIKPVFMMSPLSVAQFLEPGAIDFDILLIDEASQIQPVDALGAIARAKQLVVVGDDKQLPPTRFFSRMTSVNVQDDDDGDGMVGDVESVLGLCVAKGLPQKMLRWHYRSKHQSLIAVSNQQFYENKLFIVPSPFTAEAGMGLKFNAVLNGVFDSGGTGTNKVEARTVAEAIVRHALNTPVKSLGVATFSIKQKQAIIDELELLRRQNPETEAFFNGNSHEPFFVKNLENIQGDERDVIFISIGYARNSSGYLAMRFGPLSADGGERRLNVLISRSKLRCEVFSSIVADDIDLERAQGKGVMALKVFLQFAQSGRMNIVTESGEEPESPFEESVRRALQSKNYEVRTQIGVAGFFVDLAVSDPEHPGRYILGIECDGASYHASQSARDRDRLRQRVLEDHGWIIHRIWSTDWFQQPADQLEKVIAAIEAAKVELAASKEIASQSARLRTEITFVQREDIVEVGIEEAKWATPYMEARFSVPRAREPHELFAGQMAEIVAKIVEIEGPIHEDEILIRVRDLWGLSRAGNRIQTAVKSGLTVALTQHKLTSENGFYQQIGTQVQVRNRAQVESSGLRKAEYLPPSEVRKAILSLLDATHGALSSELATGVLRGLGFKFANSQLRTIVDAEALRLAKDGEIVEKNGMFRVNK